MNTRTTPRTIHTSPRTPLMRGIHFLYRTLIEPRSKDEDGHRHEFILNIILTSFLILIAILGLFLITSSVTKGDAYRGMSITAFISISGLFGFLLCISRKGYFQIASYLLIGMFFCSATYGMLIWGFSLTPVLATYIVTIIASSILISTRFGFFVTAVISIAMISVTYLQIHQIIPIHFYWRFEPYALKEPVQASVMFFVITAISWLSNREIERSLRRARKSERELLTERNLLEIKVEERTRELKSAQQEKLDNLYRFAEFGRLSSGIFHDLMTPLSAVVANISELEASPKELPTVKTYLTKAVHASKRMGSFLETVRKQLSTTTEKTEFLANQEITEAIDMLQYKAREARTTITFSAKEEVHLNGNPLKFHQITINLIANAIDSYRECIPKKSKQFVVVTLHASSKSAVLTVTDKGCGIDPEHLEHIFDPFFTTKTPDRGMGLGLSTTKHIVEKDFGGTITITSIKDKGTSINIELPFHHAHATTPHSPDGEHSHLH